MNTTISTVSLTKLLTIGAALALLVLIVGGSVAQRMEQRAASDRLFLGELGYGQGVPQDAPLGAPLARASKS